MDTMLRLFPDRLWFQRIRWSATSFELCTRGGYGRCDTAGSIPVGLPVDKLRSAPMSALRLRAVEFYVIPEISTERGLRFAPRCSR